jgi:hypothetical protein
MITIKKETIAKMTALYIAGYTKRTSGKVLTPAQIEDIKQGVERELQDGKYKKVDLAYDSIVYHSLN